MLATSTRVNTTPTAGPSNGTDSSDFTAELSPSGRLVLFADNGSNLSASDGNGKADIFVKDTSTGELFRISKTSSGADTDGDSLYPSFGQVSFNSPSALVVFQSAATNLISNDTEGFVDAFITDYRIPPRGFAVGTRLDVPPDVTVRGKKLTIGLEEFSGVSFTANDSNRPSSTAASRIRYRITVKKVADADSLRIGAKTAALTAAASTSDIIRKTTKKTSVTVSKLSSGTYTTSYRTTVSRTSSSRRVSSRALIKSDTSPVQRVTVD